MGGGDGDERQMMPVEGRTCCGPVKYLLPFWCVHWDFLNVVQLITGLTTVSGGALHSAVLLCCVKAVIVNTL